MFENIVFWLGPVLAFEVAMFALIYVVARAILREEHGQEAEEAAEDAGHTAAPQAAKLAA